MQQAVIGIFESEREAKQARQSLVSAGFSPTGVWNTDAVEAAALRNEPAFRKVFQDSLGSDDHPHIEHYSEGITRGDPVLVVMANTDEEADRVKNIMETCGAVDVEERARQWGKIVMNANSSNEQSGATAAVGTKQTIPVVEEELQVGKRQVDRGTVRIYTRVTEKPVEKTVTLKEQQVIVERRPVTRTATEADFANEERIIEVRRTAEEPVIAKTARVVEEVEIGRTETEHTETIRDTIRRKDVDVEGMQSTSKSRTQKPSEKRPNV